ncbi:MAG: branched-chain amino acid ABC transporter permease, partial [Achromobacter sp.]
MNLRDLLFIALFAVGVSVITLVTSSGVWLTFIMMSLYAALLSQAWNILGGYAGQLSFGHALFFGVGAYTQAVAQLSGGINPWVGLVMAIVAGVIVALVVGALTFRYGLKGSYFALVTLAFAEVFRILALSATFTGGGVGLMVPLRGSIANMQFASRHGYIFLLLAFVVAALLVTAWLRHSRTGAYMQAVRDNEDAARAVGVNPFQVKL